MVGAELLLPQPNVARRHLDKLKPADKRYCALDCQYEMTLNSESQVEEVDSAEASAMPQQKFNFVDFAELEGMKLSALKKRAKEVEVDEEKLEEADDADDVKGTVISLILEKMV